MLITKLLFFIVIDIYIDLIIKSKKRYFLSNLPIDVFSPDFVLLRVLPDRVLDLKDSVVVGVGDGDLLVVLQHLVVDGPGLVGDGLTNNVDRPRVALADLRIICFYKFQRKII